MLALAKSFRKSKKRLPGTNTLAYYDPGSIKKLKKFKGQASASLYRKILD